MPQRSRLLEMMQGPEAPLGASPDAVGTDSIPTPELPQSEAPPPGGAPAAEEPGASESQNAIMQSMGANPQQQLTPEEEEMIKARINLAARERLLGGGLGG